MGIFIDQTGYLPVSRKVATTTFPCNFQLIDSTTQHAVYDGVSTDSGMDESAGEQVYQLDFSKVSSPGSYYVLAGNGERSHTFVIGEHVYEQLQLDLMKCFYFQRCGYVHLPANMPVNIHMPPAIQRMLFFQRIT